MKKPKITLSTWSHNNFRRWAQGYPSCSKYLGGIQKIVESNVMDTVGNQMVKLGMDGKILGMPNGRRWIKSIKAKERGYVIRAVKKGISRGNARIRARVKAKDPWGGLPKVAKEENKEEKVKVVGIIKAKAKARVFKRGIPPAKDIRGYVGTVV